MPSSARSFAQVDVFSARAGFGNPVAVVLDADGLSDEAMQQLANWTNLSETTFVLPPSASGADYRLRIFTPEHELPFAGHPTIGTGRALLDAGRLPDRSRWVQECGAGLVELRRSSADLISFAAPSPEITPSPISTAELAVIMGGPEPSAPLLVEIGPRWITGRMDLGALDDLRPDASAFLRAAAPKLFDGITLYAVDDDRHVHLRSFFKALGQFVEDPVCGSGNAAVGAHLLYTGTAGDVPTTYQAHQGKHRGRDGQITVTVGDPIRVGGQAVTVVNGTITTPSEWNS